MNAELARYKEMKKIVERARAVRVFMAHLTIFIVGNIFPGAWNGLTYYVNGNDFWWFPIPLISGVSAS